MNTTKYIKVASLEIARANAPVGTKFIHTASVLDDSGTGGFCGFYATAEQEAEYNEGMARIAEMG
ncbi:MAG: hypothetical protein EBR82_82080 [Caulobacteraceae bacterium]|nr:hypothetical protein [Caulobacteraceae bacterium]